MKYIAGVVRDGRFSGSMINEKTQVVQMEEWTSDSLSCEDAKRILQGTFIDLLCSKLYRVSRLVYCNLIFHFLYFKFLSGGLLMVPQKHKDSSRFIYQSGFFITTNVFPDFGDPTDCEAIKKRLAIFHTKTLKKKNTFITSKYMD